jgi:hypothetical protein
MLRAQSGEAAVPLSSSTLQLLSPMNKAQGETKSGNAQTWSGQGKRKNSKFNEEYAPGRPAMRDPRGSAVPRSACC